MKKWISALLVAMLATGNALASEKDEAMKMVSDAATAVTKDKAAALAEIGNPKGRFVKGELYVFAYDLTGTMAAHPINAKLVGKALLDVPDANGKMFRKDIIDGVKSVGMATVDYKYKNPQSGVIEDKVSYCKKAGELAVCAGYYK
jgi:signal transduction histidine kinase